MNTTTTIDPSGRPNYVRTIADQIGTGNILAISGGRLSYDEKGQTLILPVASGYQVLVTYQPVPDTYTVRRVMIRGGKVFEKGAVENVYADQVGEVAYRASCFRDGAFGEVAR